MIQKLQRYSLYVFLFSLNFEVWDPLHTDGFFSISKLTGIIYFAVSIPAIIKYKTGSNYKPVLKVILTFFSLLFLINAIHAQSTDDTIIDFTILQNIILFWIIINHVRKEPLILERGLMAFSLGAATLALLYYNGVGIEITNEGRVSIFGDNQNIIAQRMCFGITIVAMLVLQNSLQLKKTRFLYLALTPLMFGLLIATGSRLSIITLAIIFISALVLLKTNTFLVKGLVFILGIVFFIFMFRLAFENEMLRERFLTSLNEGNLSNRDIIWEQIFPLILDHPIFGVGQSGYTTFCMNAFGRYMSPHNVVLEIVCFTGFFGLIVYGIFLYLVFRQGYLKYRESGLLLPMLLSISVFGILLGSHILEVKLGWVILAYITTSLEVQYQKKEKHQQKKESETMQVLAV